MSKSLRPIPPLVQRLMPWTLLSLLGVGWLYNLGLMPLLADEPIRALIALEMHLRDAWIAPKILNEFYYKKPPLYNWLLIGLFRLTGDFSEWIIRIPAVVSFFGLAATVYYIVRRHLDARTAFLTAVLLLLGVRVLFYEALLGHIDPLYCWVTYVQLMAFHILGRRERWTALFVLTWFLAAVGIMLKGLPSILFQVFTLLAYLWTRGALFRLFSLGHMLGVLCFLLPLGLYFWAYSHIQPLDVYFATLWDQSSMRTPLQHRILNTLWHLLVFPVHVFAQLLPGSLLAFYLLGGDFFRKHIWQHEFLRFNLMVVAVNIWVYWISPGEFPRYIMMLHPMLYVVGVYAYFQRREHMPRTTRSLEGVMLGAGVLLLGAYTLPPWIPALKDMTGMYIWMAALGGLTLLLLVAYMRWPGRRLLIFLQILALSRIGFDVFVLEHRWRTSPESQLKSHALRVGEMTRGQPLYLYEHTALAYMPAYYITCERGTILDRRFQVEAGPWYLVSDFVTMPPSPVVRYTFETHMWGTYTQQLVQFPQAGGAASSPASSP